MTGMSKNRLVPLIERPGFSKIQSKSLNIGKDKPVRFAYMNNCVGCFHRFTGFVEINVGKISKQR